MKSNQDNVSSFEMLKEILSDTSGIAGSPEERAEWKKYFENQRALEKEIALLLEKENSMIDINKTTCLGKIKEVLRKILTDTHGECSVPDHVLRDLARLILPSIMEMVQSEEGKAQLRQWQAEQEKAKRQQANKKDESV